MDLNPTAIIARYQNKPKQRNDERAALIGEIAALTNKSRLEAKYEPWTTACIAVKLHKVKTPALKDLFHQCNKKTFDGKKFWGTVKNKYGK